VSEWHLANAGDVQGPLSTEAVIDGLAAGRIPPSASAWREGMPGWQRLDAIPELRKAINVRGFDAMPRKQLLRLGLLSAGSGVLLLTSNLVRMASGHEVHPAWAGVAGGVMAPGVLMLWKAWRRK
jgi:hypothetical protein